MVDAWLLVAPHRDRLVSMARRRTPTRQDAEDVASEAMLRVATFPALDPARVGQILTSVTTRLCADLARRRAVEAAAAPRLLAVPPDPLAALLDGFEARWLADVPLTGAERALLAAKASGLRPAEVAGSLGLTVDGAKSALKRARRKTLAAWRATLGVFGLSRLRRLLPAGAVVAAALAVVLAPLAREERERQAVSVIEPLPAAERAPARRASALPRGSLRPAVPAAPPQRAGVATATPAPVAVTVPGVHGDGYGYGGLTVVLDVGEDPASRLVRCLRNGVEVDVASGSATCRE